MLLNTGVSLFLFGCFIGLEYGLPQSLKMILLALTLLSVMTIVLWRKNCLMNVGICCFFLSLGLFNGSRVGPSAEEQLAPYFGHTAIVQGMVDVTSLKEQDAGYSFILKTKRLVVDGMEHTYAGGLRVFIDKKQLPKNLQPNGSLTVSGQLEQMTSFRNPGSFDSKLWNRVHNIGGRLQKVVLASMESKADIWNQAGLLNKDLRIILKERLTSKEASLLAGMMLGGSDIDDETRDIFTTNGLAHLLSVSGAHLAFLCSLLSIALRPVSVRWRKLLILFLLFCYAALCGFKAPVLRALCMSAVTLYGGSGGERGLLLGLTAIGLLFYEPLWLLDLGFQLSFMAVAGIIWLQPKCQSCLENVLPQFVSELLSVTMAAQLAVLPLEIAHFHQVSVISMVSNLLLVPVLELCVCLSLGGMAINFVSLNGLDFGQYLFMAAEFLLKQVLIQAEWMASFPLSTLVIGSLPLWCGAVYYVFIMVWADVPVAMYLSNLQRRCILLLCGIVLGAVIFWTHWGPHPMSVYFLDVGQGDCAVVVTNNSIGMARRVIVFDTGGLKNFSTGSKILAPFLRTLGKKEIDMLVLSHYDFDHVGGAADLARVCNCKQVLLPKEAITQESENLVRNMARYWRSSNFNVAEKESKYCFNDVWLKVLDTPDRLSRGNDASTLAEIKYKDYSLLFTGDLGGEREEQLENLGRYSVLKAGHHGSRYSSSDSFLNQVRPKFTVISCGINNRFGHPHQEALERFDYYGSKVLRTDKSGCVKLVFYNNMIRAYGYDEGRWIDL